MNSIKGMLLAAGYGTRLLPHTKYLPKCLMPIGDVPLLEYWLYYMQDAGINDVLINKHHLSKKLNDFLDRPHLNWVKSVFEEKLLGTAGTLVENYNFFKGHTTLLVHADNWTNGFLKNFIKFHLNSRPKGCSITMMLFHTETPESCGIVELDINQIVVKFHEKKRGNNGNLANAAIYILEPEVIEWLKMRPWISDFTTEVIPYFIGKIATWTMESDFRDIGTIEALKKSQKDFKPILSWNNNDSWSLDYKNNIVKKLNLNVE